MPIRNGNCTVVFDSNISKVEIYTDNEFTTLLTTISSSNTSFVAAAGSTLYFKVYLSQTYEIDNVSSSAPLITINDLTSNTFNIWFRSECTITITSKIVVNSTTLETTLHTAGKYCDKNILVKSSDSNLIAENIKKDVSVFGVTGSYAGADVSDTTATQGDVLSGKYFYGADGVKTEGTMTNHTETSITLNAGTGDQYVPAGHYSDILTKLVLNSDAASKIKQGEVILGVTGSYAGSGGSPIEVATETEMANILSSATADDNGKIYRYTGTTGTYVNGALYWLEVPQETEDELAGTWVFNDPVDAIPSRVSVNFIDLNKKQFNDISPMGISIYYGFLDDNGSQDGLLAYGVSGWMNTAYKTITITSKLSEVTNGDTLLAWLQANATKQ